MDQKTNGWLNGLIGVTIFSGSLSATRVAVAGFEPLFLTVARASIAGLLAFACLMLMRQPRPKRHELVSLTLTMLGVVIGFPLLTALALRHITSAHSIVFIGLLPLSTAIFAVIRGGERPRPAFWLFSLSGSALVAGFALFSGAKASLQGDILMLLAIVVCGLGYAEGAKLSRHLGGWQVISWALLLALPFMLPACWLFWPNNLSAIPTVAWLGLIYVSFFSMFIGFIFWYRGLAQGGIAAVGQLQLLQPFMGLSIAAILLGETVTPAMIGITFVVILCVAGAKRFA